MFEECPLRKGRCPFSAKVKNEYFCGMGQKVKEGKGYKWVTKVSLLKGCPDELKKQKSAR